MTIDPSPSEEFPDRPTHRDFIAMSMAAQELDNLADTIPDEEFNPTTILSIDEESLHYFTRNRVDGCIEKIIMMGGQLDKSFLMALYMDAFSMGIKFQEWRRA